MITLDAGTGYDLKNNLILIILDRFQINKIQK
jgi:hypothetical protein